MVSTLAVSKGSPDIWLGTAYGSNITNIALILELVALISRITRAFAGVAMELPILPTVNALSGLATSG